MATAGQISLWRQYANEPDDTNGWTDQKISDYIDSFAIDGVADVDWAAHEYWTQKASATASLVDVSENGSSRKMSDAHKNAVTMASYFRTRSPRSASLPTVLRPRTRAIVRP